MSHDNSDHEQLTLFFSYKGVYQSDQDILHCDNNQFKNLCGLPQQKFVVLSSTQSKWVWTPPQSPYPLEAYGFNEIFISTLAQDGVWGRGEVGGSCTRNKSFVPETHQPDLGTCLCLTIGQGESVIFPYAQRKGRTENEEQ